MGEKEGKKKWEWTTNHTTKVKLSLIATEISHPLLLQAKWLFDSIFHSTPHPTPPPHFPNVIPNIPSPFDGLQPCVFVCTDETIPSPYDGSNHVCLCVLMKLSPHPMMAPTMCVCVYWWNYPLTLWWLQTCEFVCTDETIPSPYYFLQTCMFVYTDENSFSQNYLRRESGLSSFSVAATLQIHVVYLYSPLPCQLRYLLLSCYLTMQTLSTWAEQTLIASLRSSNTSASTAS